jgi:hypothetical protein
MKASLLAVPDELNCILDPQVPQMEHYRAVEVCKNIPQNPLAYAFA